MGKGLVRHVTVYLDTHAAAWLYEGAVKKLSKTALNHIEHAGELLISPMVVLELEYMHERKRIVKSGAEIAQTLGSHFGVQVCGLPFAAVVQEAAGIKWTTDPFDRLIVAQASAAGQSTLITVDECIRKNYNHAVW